MHTCSVLSSVCAFETIFFRDISSIIIIIMTQSNQLKPPAVAIVRQNSLSSASCRASVAVTPVSVSRQIWWTQVVDGLQYPLTDFRQTFVIGASCDKDELIRSWGQKFIIIAAEVSSTQHCRQNVLSSYLYGFCYMYLSDLTKRSKHTD